MYSSRGRVSDKTIAYLVSLYAPLQMLYSHLNPMLYLVILQDFQNYVASLYRKALFKRNEDGKNPQKPRTSGCNTFQRVQSLEQKSKRIRSIRKAIVWIFFLGLAMLLTVLLYVVLVATGTSEKTRSFKVSSRLMHHEFRSKKLRQLMFQEINSFNDENETRFVRELCAENHGVFRFSFQRCFFILDHDHPGLNFSSQVSDDYFFL